MTDTNPKICAIAAMDDARVIGNGDKLPAWNIPEDLDHVKMVTKGCPLIMGRATFESIHGYRGTNPQSGPAWPNRLNVVISTRDDYFNHQEPENVCLATSPQEGLDIALAFARANHIERVFIFGGATIYGALLPQTDYLHLTEVEGTFEGDAFFPDFKHDFKKNGVWEMVSYAPQDNGNHKFAFNVYKRVL